MSDVFQETLDNMTREQIAGSPGGIASKYVKLNDHMGVKLYCETYNRDACMERQEEMAEHDLAPDVYGVIDITHPKNGYRYGYFTEHVQVIGDTFETRDEYSWISNMGPHQSFNIVDMEELDVVCEKRWEFNQLQCINDFMEELSLAAGMDFTDGHWHNIGIKDGHLVCIDFGDEGLDIVRYQQLE